jgi:arylsulfatase A-like enzyme
MKKITKIAILGLLFVILSSCSSTAQQKTRKAPQKKIVKTVKQPNVLFILADDLGINALNCYGNDLVESPNIDRLYNEGMHFTNGYSNDPTCAPSRASIMSGQYVPRHQVYRVADRYKKQKNVLPNMKYLPPENYKLQGSGAGLSLDRVTLGEAFQQNGYATSAYGKWHLGKKELGIPNQGFTEGFEMIGHYNFKTSPKQKDIDNTEYSADVITYKTKEFIAKSVKENKPFFAYVPYYLVHKPLEPKPEYLARFKEKLKGNKDIGYDEIQVLAMIKSLDDSVGELMEYVKSLGIEEETIIVFTSDNGHYKTESNIFNQPYRGVKGETFEGGIRVPYVFKWKGKIKPNSASKEPIIHVDIYPTVLGLTQSKTPENYVLDGEDISPILFETASKTKREALVWEYTNYARYNVKKKSFTSEWVNVIQMDDYKLTEVVESNSYYLFNLNKDPYETNEIAKENSQVVEKLKQRLSVWKNEVGYEAPKKNPEYIGTN